MGEIVHVPNWVDCIDGACADRGARRRRRAEKDGRHAGRSAADAAGVQGRIDPHLRSENGRLVDQHGQGRQGPAHHLRPAQGADPARHAQGRPGRKDREARPAHQRGDGPALRLRQPLRGRRRPRRLRTLPLQGHQGDRPVRRGETAQEVQQRRRRPWRPRRRPRTRQDALLPAGQFLRRSRGHGAGFAAPQLRRGPAAAAPAGRQRLRGRPLRPRWDRPPHRPGRQEVGPHARRLPQRLRHGLQRRRRTVHLRRRHGVGLGHGPGIGRSASTTAPAPPSSAGAMGPASGRNTIPTASAPSSTSASARRPAWSSGPGPSSRPSTRRRS